MNTVYTKTDKYSLNLYGDTDPADLCDGYNDSMHIIDETLQNHIDKINTKLETVAHDGTLKGSGIITDPLKLNLNHTAANNDAGNTVYPALVKNKETDGSFEKTDQEFLALGEPAVTPYIGYVLSFSDRNKIGATNLTSNKIMPYMIFDNMVRFFA